MGNIQYNGKYNGKDNGKYNGKWCNSSSLLYLDVQWGMYSTMVRTMVSGKIAYTWMYNGEYKV